MSIEVQIADILTKKGLKISTTESCTGGLLSSKLTDVSGSSAFITLNLVTYANEAKERMLGVKLNSEGAVSEHCSYQMAKGLCNLTKSDICISTTGIAGPTGGTVEKPVGLMYSTIYTNKKFKNYKIQVDSNLKREDIKKQFVQKVLENILDFIKEL